MVRTYVFLRGCTLAVPLDIPLPVTFSFVEVFSSPEPEIEVEKCFDEGARARPGVTGFCVCTVGVCVTLVGELEFVVESKRG